MSIDNGGSFENRQLRPELGRADNPFQDQVRLESAENHRSGLQDISQEKLFVVGNMSGMTQEQHEALGHSLPGSAGQWGKVSEALRSVYNKMQSGADNGTNENWIKNYVAKLCEVLTDNNNHSLNELGFRIAVPVQSFLPGANGNMVAETLYALYPPKEIGINEKIVTMPMYSGDPVRDKQLRENPSLANSISTHELVFRCKVNNLMARRDRPEIQQV